MSHRNEVFKIAVAGIVLASTLAVTSSYAEDGPTVLKGGGGGDLVQKGVDNALVNPNAITDNSAANGQNGREFKANDANNQGNAGMAAAIAAGASMVATAIPLLASIEPIQVAAGATLMGLAGLEFAQAAASGKSANDNAGQRDTLTKNPGQSTGSQVSDPTAAGAAALKNDPQLNQFLQGRGINPESFIDQFASGSLTDPQAILNATGNKTAVSAEAMAAGQQLAAGTAGALLEGKPEPRGMPDIIRVSNNDDIAKGLANDGAKGAIGGGAGAAPAGGGGGAKPAEAGALPGKSAALAASAPGKPGKGATAGGALTAEGESSMLNLFNRFGLPGAVGGAAAARAAAGSDFMKLGILKTNPKQNIFQLAHRNYRSYQKWRRTKTLAQRAD